MVFAASVSLAQDQSISGTVTDAGDGNPLPGVTILVPGTTIGTSTDIDGQYSLNVPQQYNTLEISFVGYRTQRVEIDGRSTINIALEEDVQLLDDIVVVGFGALPRRQITSSISQVRSEDFADATLTTAEQAIQGRVAGVQFTNTSGVLGAPTSIRIRGAASISASTTPLIVIDGVPITNPTTSGSSAIGEGMGGQGMNPLLNLDPNDIESFEVLKDAAASAIYGSRGSNGVILIQTKQGRAGTQQVSINTYAGISDYTNRYDMMNGEEFTRIWNDAGVNFFERLGIGEIFGVSDEEAWNTSGMNAAVFGVDAALGTEDVTNTDWVDLVTQTGYLQQTNVSVSGGSDRTRYYLSGTYRWEEGYVQNNELNRYSARLRLNHDISDRLSIGLNLNPSRTDNFRVYVENAVAAPFTYGALIYPNISPYLEDGTLRVTDGGPNPFGLAFSGTPVSNMEGVDARSNLTQLLAASNLQFNVTENLTYNADFAVDLFQLQEHIHNATFSTNGFPDGTAFASNNQYRNFNFTNTLQFRETWDDHTLNAMVGFTAQQSDNVSFDTFARNFASDRLRNIDSAADVTSASGFETTFTFMGYLSRINYTFRDRYIISLSGRVDGSSRFSDENQYGFFPAASVGWIVSDESWYGVDAVDFLKLRGSVGQTGNAEIGNFPTLGLVGFGNNYNNVPGGRVTQVPNPDLRWEKTTQYDAALEFGILDSRIRGSIGYYLKDTDDLLMNVPISRVNGFTSYTANVGAVENRGWEFELTADIARGDFSWTSNLNVSTVENEVTTLVDGEDQVFGQNLLREGESLGAFYLVRYAGPNPENGNAQWLDLDGEVTESYSLANRVVAGDPFPDFFGGFTNTFAYRGIDLRVFFQYQLGNDIYRADGTFTDSNLNSLFNQSTRQNDYWTPENTDAANPKPILFTSNGSQNSTRYLEDGSYLRLKQLTLGYRLPASLIGPNVNARIFAQGENLLTWTNFNGLDPEAASGGNIQASDIFFQMPQSRVISLGVNLTF